MKGLPGNPVTDNNGAYTGTIPAGWSGTVTPTEINFVFDPETRTYSSVGANQINQDFTALQRVLSIFGYVRTAAGAGIPDVVMSGPPASATTDVNGFYQIYVVRGWSGTVTPTKAGFTFQPASATYTNLAQNVGPASYAGAVSQSSSDTPGGNSNSGNQDSGSSGNTNGGTTSGDSGTTGTQDTGATEAPAASACGAGACGAGIVGWLPLSILGWCGLKAGRSLHRRGTR